jgi:hypothetical protein
MIAWWAASFDPSCLHHQVLLNRVISSRVQIGRLVPGFRLSVLTSWSPRTSVVSGGGFGGPVSASKIPFLADKGSTERQMRSAAARKRSTFLREGNRFAAA